MATGDPFLDFALSLRGDALTPIMKAISDANSEYAYLILIPLIYWVFSRRAGIRLMVVDAMGTSAAVIMKDTFALPRPPNAGETAWLAGADGYGFPSGHTTAAATSWAALAVLLKNWRVAVLGALVTTAVAFSRLYLGVHYSRDVAGAVGIGLLLGLALLFAAPPLEARLEKLPSAVRYACVLAFPALLAVNASNDAIVILCATAGALAGHLAANDLGWVMATGHPKGLPLFGALRLAIGLPVLGGLAVGLGSPSHSGAVELALRFTVLGLFTTLLGPRLFMAVESKLPPSKRGASGAT